MLFYLVFHFETTSLLKKSSDFNRIVCFLGFFVTLSQTPEIALDFFQIILFLVKLFNVLSQAAYASTALTPLSCKD